MIGQKILNFHINERLGEGGMGTVYKATDINLQRAVAIKMLHPFLVNNPDSFRRFQNEAHLSAKISHPNVATLYNFQEADKAQFIVMEYVEGKALDDILKFQGKLPEEEASKITLQILEGLSAAHELGIMHRDLKPGNIMITSRGFVKLMDFGIARMENTERMTRQNSVIGTLEYLAPELVKGGTPGKASDLYAVGVLFHEMLSGRTLYAGDSEAALMYQIAHKAPNIQLPGIHKDLIRIIKKLTHKQVARRYSSTQAVIQDLEKVYRNSKINPSLLNKKVSTQPRAATAFSLDKVKLAPPKVPSLGKLNLPFDIDYRILAGALVFCLFILLISFFKPSPEPSPIQPSQEELVSITGEKGQRESPNPQQLSRASSSLPGSGTGNEINFIEKFDDKPTQVSEKNTQKESTGKKTEEKKPKMKTEEKQEVRKKSQVSDAGKKEHLEQQEELVKKEIEDDAVEPPPAPLKKPQSDTKIEKAPVKSQPERYVKVRIPDMYLSASFTETISTNTHNEGQNIYLRTSSPIYQGDHLIVPKGSLVRAKIAKLKRAIGKKKAFLAIHLKAVQAANGQWLAVSYPEYSNLAKMEVSFPQGLKLNKIKLKSTNLTLNY